MNTLPHSSAKPSHYNKSAEHYDVLNEENSKPSNQTIEEILKGRKVNNVLDLSCGTGSQVFWLAERGYNVLGADINAAMLKIAKAKAQRKHAAIKFLKGDMRNSRLGTFDAVITIFNSIGHLTKEDFEKTIRNIRANLSDDGLYVFDIFNLDYLAAGNNITKLSIDWQKTVGTTRTRKIQYSTLSGDGILTSHTLSHIQEGSSQTKLSKESQTLQIYTARQLKEILHKHGFKTLQQCDMDGSRLLKNKTERILTVAMKC